MKYWIHLPETVDKNLSGKIKQVTAGSIEEALVSQYASIADSLTSALLITSDYLLKTINDPKAIASYQHDISKAAEYRRVSRRGQPAPDFLLVDTAGRKYSLADFKGKTIYLDVWASWCGPCIAQFPAAKKLYEKYIVKDNLVFLAISVDNAKKSWVNGIKLHQPDGLQLWAEGGFANVFTKSYGSRGLPHYVVIGKDGKIINFEAPQPGNEPAISNLLNEAIAR
jgi:thiol-disulfide isomerase/thioredoxin